MDKYGKTIKIFLIDGLPNGRLTCELSNWTGKAIKIPRSVLKSSFDRKELAQTGIYFLFGKDPEDPENDMVYIGETDVLSDRLKQHLDKKEFWNEAIAISSKDDNLNKAHVRYLESKLYEIAHKVARYKIENSQIPNPKVLSEAETAEMDEFIVNVRIIIGALGYKVFEEMNIEKKPDKVFIIKSARGADAKGQFSAEGFIVFKDSHISSDLVPSVPKWLINMRESLIQANIVKNNNGDLIFMKDHLFSSPSTAAGIVMGRPANGLAEWKNSNGVTLKQFEMA